MICYCYVGQSTLVGIWGRFARMKATEDIKGKLYVQRPATTFDISKGKSIETISYEHESIYFVSPKNDYSLVWAYL